jgi:hypothetical protein
MGKRDEGAAARFEMLAYRPSAIGKHQVVLDGAVSRRPGIDEEAKSSGRDLRCGAGGGRCDGGQMWGREQDAGMSPQRGRSTARRWKGFSASTSPWGDKLQPNIVYAMEGEKRTPGLVLRLQPVWFLLALPNILPL